MTALFPKWTNKLPAVATALAVIGAPMLVFLVWYYGSPWYLEVGYAPDQPIPYSHAQHAGMYGIDCRYCHQGVEKGPKANIPSTQTCANCHTMLGLDKESLAPVRDTYVAVSKGEPAEPIEWIKVHMLPDYAYFDHSAHVKIGDAGVGCRSCHGRVDKMEVVHQDQPLSMGWCLDCHRNPEQHVRPASEITNMTYEQDVALATQLIEKNQINPPTHCSACHR